MPIRRILPALALVACVAGSGCSPPAITWAVTAGDDVDPETLEVVEVRITAGPCQEWDAVPPHWVGVARRSDLGASFTAPASLTRGLWCFAAVGRTSSCGRIAYGELQRDLPAESEPFEVVLHRDVGPSDCVGECRDGVCVPPPGLDAGTMGDGGSGADGGPPVDGGPPPPTSCWPGPLPEFPPPPPENEHLYRATRMPLDAELCATALSTALVTWGDEMCASQVGPSYVWSVNDAARASFDGCVDAARYVEVAPSVGGVQLLERSPTLGEDSYNLCVVSFAGGEPVSAGGASFYMGECIPQGSAQAAVLCRRPIRGSLEVDTEATFVDRISADAVYDPADNRYLVVYERDDAIWRAFVDDYGESVSADVLAPGPAGGGPRLRTPRVALGSSSSGATRFGVIWEQDDGTTGGAQTYVILDGSGATVAGPAPLVDPDMHRFFNTVGSLDVAFDASARQFLFAGLAARQSETDYIYGRLQLRAVSADGSATPPQQILSVDDGPHAPGFRWGDLRLLYHPSRNETLVLVASEAIVLPSGSLSPSSHLVLPEAAAILAPIVGTDDYIGVDGSSIRRFGPTGAGRGGSTTWTPGDSGDGAALHFPPGSPGAMAGTVLLQRGERLQYATPAGQPCYPVSAWTETSTTSRAFLVANSETGGFARFWFGAGGGLSATIYLSNGERY